MESMWQNRTIIILISMIWGFGLALLFRQVCQNDQCVIMKVPPSFNKNGGVIYDKNRCYKLQQYPSACVY